MAARDGACDTFSASELAAHAAMAPVHVLDPYYLAITCLVTFGMQASFFAIAATFKFDLVTDLAYGTNFIFLAVLTLLLKRTYYARQITVAVLVCAWGVRLAAYLFTRIMIIGKDSRFDETRNNFVKFAAFWILQFVAVWTIFLPECLLASSTHNPAHGWNDYLGYALFGVGLLIETVADLQKFLYKRNEPKGKWCAVGVWSWSRHPNYFGELLVWWGLFAACASAFAGTWRWLSVVGPAFLTVLLLFLSGIPPLEKRADARYWTDGEYQEYKRRTSCLIPFPPALFRPLPGWLKATLFFEWPLYNTPNDGPGEARAIART